jgi:hypothetical protein
MSIYSGQFRAYNKPYWMSVFATISPTSGQRVTKTGNYRPAKSIIFNDIESPQLGPKLALIIELTETQRTTTNGYRQARSD